MPVDQVRYPRVPYRPYRATLDREKGALYDAVLDGLLACKKRIDLPRGANSANFTELLTAVRHENPLAMYEKATLETRRLGPFGNTATIDVDYGIRPERMRQLGKELQRNAETIVERYRASTHHPAALALQLHDHLASTCQYDLNAELCHETAGALVYRRAVCEGIAKAYKLLCDLAGIRCMVAVGSKGELHAWNVVEVAGHWAHIDVTNDIMPDDTPSRAYFGLSDQELAQYCTPKGSYPACPYNLGFFESRGLYARTLDEVGAIARKQFSMGMRSFEFKAAPSLAAERISNAIARKSPTRCVSIATHQGGVMKASAVQRR